MRVLSVRLQCIEVKSVDYTTVLIPGADANGTVTSVGLLFRCVIEFRSIWSIPRFIGSTRFLDFPRRKQFQMD